MHIHKLFQPFKKNYDSNIFFNQIFDWEPEPFGIEDGKYEREELVKQLDEKVAEEPKGMPANLKDHIISEADKNKGHVSL